MIDTGIRRTHAEFGGRVSTAGYTAISDGNGTNDCHGHGTHVAGTTGGALYGVAKSVTLHAVRVLGCSGSGSTSGVIAGVDWVTANAIEPAVANMSLGGGASSALDTAVRNSITSGVTYAVAAGNSNLVTITGGGGDPCTGCEEYTGTLSGTGDVDYYPNGSYYYSGVSGTHRGWLQGPSNTDFDLRLQKWNGFWWATVAVSEGSTSVEQITYTGTAGYYRWRVNSFSGSGPYTFWLQRP